MFCNNFALNFFPRMEEFQKSCEDKFSQIDENSVKAAKIDLAKINLLKVSTKVLQDDRERVLFSVIYGTPRGNTTEFINTTKNLFKRHS